MNQEEQPDQKEEGLSFFENNELYSFGIITQRGYQELQDQIHRWIVRGIVAFGIIGVMCSLSLVGFGILLTRQGNTTDTIQDQRYKSLLDACLDQNARHDRVFVKIDDAVAKTPPPPARQEAARRAAKPFKLILEAAVPYTKHCRAEAQDRVGRTP